MRKFAVSLFFGIVVSAQLPTLHALKFSVDCTLPIPSSELLSDPEHFCNQLRDRLRSRRDDEEQTVQIQLDVKLKSPAPPASSSMFSSMFRRESFANPTSTEWSILMKVSAFVCGLSVPTAIYIVVQRLFACLELFAPPNLAAEGRVEGRVQALWIHGEFLTEREAQNKLLEQQFMNQLTSVVVWVCVCQMLVMASIMAKRDEVAKMVPNLMVSVAMLFAKRQLDLPDKWKMLGGNWAGKIHFAVAIVGAPMQMAMVDYGIFTPDAPLQAHMKCTLILSSVVHLSLGWFCVSNSVSSTLILLGSSLRGDSSDVNESLWYTVGTANVLASMIFLARHCYFKRAPSHSEPENTDWRFAICAAAPISVALLLRRGIETESEMFDGLLAGEAQHQWNMVGGACLICAAVIQYPPQSLRTRLEFFNVPNEAIEQVRFQIAPMARGMAVCQSVVSIAYIAARGDFAHLVVPFFFLCIFVLSEPSIHTMSSIHSFTCLAMLPLHACLSGLGLLGPMQLWPPCFGLPFFGAMISPSFQSHLVEMLFVNAVIFVSGIDNQLRASSFAATLISCIALFFKLAMLQILHCPGTYKEFRNWSQTSDAVNNAHCVTADSEQDDSDSHISNAASMVTFSHSQD